MGKIKIIEMKKLKSIVLFATFIVLVSCKKDFDGRIVGTWVGFETPEVFAGSIFVTDTNFTSVFTPVAVKMVFEESGKGFFISTNNGINNDSTVISDFLWESENDSISFDWLNGYSFKYRIDNNKKRIQNWSFFRFSTYQSTNYMSRTVLRVTLDLYKEK